MTRYGVRTTRRLLDQCFGRGVACISCRRYQEVILSRWTVRRVERANRSPLRGSAGSLRDAAGAPGSRPVPEVGPGPRPAAATLSRGREKSVWRDRLQPALPPHLPPPTPATRCRGPSRPGPPSPTVTPPPPSPTTAQMGSRGVSHASPAAIPLHGTHVITDAGNRTPLPASGALTTVNDGTQIRPERRIATTSQSPRSPAIR
jgi:hypothetical protein